MIGARLGAPRRRLRAELRAGARDDPHRHGVRRARCPHRCRGGRPRGLARDHHPSQRLGARSGGRHLDDEDGLHDVRQSPGTRARSLPEDRSRPAHVHPPEGLPRSRRDGRGHVHGGRRPDPRGHRRRGRSPLRRCDPSRLRDPGTLGRRSLAAREGSLRRRRDPRLARRTRGADRRRGSGLRAAVRNRVAEAREAFALERPRPDLSPVHGRRAGLGTRAVRDDGGRRELARDPGPGRGRAAAAVRGRGRLRGERLCCPRDRARRRARGSVRRRRAAGRDSVPGGHVPRRQHDRVRRPRGRHTEPRSIRGRVHPLPRCSLTLVVDASRSHPRCSPRSSLLSTGPRARR
jgi:hypothetical protein